MSSHRLAVLLSAAALSLFAAAKADANNLIANGSFEDPGITFPWYENFGTSTGDPNYAGVGVNIPGWTITTNNVDIVSDLTSTPAAADGNQYLDLVGTGNSGGISSQAFTTVAGQTYTLSFAYGNNPWSTSTASALIQVLIDGLSANITHDTSTTSAIDWTTFSMNFVGTGNPMTLSFLTTVGGNNGGVLLDDISVSATPLPATWTMMLTGLIGFGLVVYRRRVKVAAASAA